MDINIMNNNDVEKKRKERNNSTQYITISREREKDERKQKRARLNVELPVMGEGLAMLKQVIAQLQQLLHHSSSSSSLPSPLLQFHFPPPPHNHHHHHHLLHRQQPPQEDRCCFLTLDNNSAEDDAYYNLVMKIENSGDFKMVEPYKPPSRKRSRKERDQGKSIKTARSTSTEIMDQRVWQQFPDDLFEAVIARLPTATFFRSRSVCRKWDSLLTSHSFSQQCSQIAQPQSWFYTITHESTSTGSMYDPSSKKWYHPILPSFPTKTIVLPVASAGGLVCFLDIGHRNFYICNPLTRSFKELPARSVKVWSRVAVGMTTSGNSINTGYKVLWVGCDGEYEVYDSVENTWTRPGNMPSNIKVPLSLNFRSHAVLSNDTLHFMRSDPEGIVSYNMASGIWKQFIIPSPLHMTDHTLAECDGRILLVGLLSKNAATCVCIWELQKMTLLWKEVDRMPNIWCLEFYGKHIRMTCLGNKGLFMLSLRSRKMNRLVTYNVMNREWLKVPGCIIPRGRKREWIACGTAFHPCPTAVV